MLAAARRRAHVPKCFRKFNRPCSCYGLINFGRTPAGGCPRRHSARCSLYLAIKLCSEHKIRRLTAPDFSMVAFRAHVPKCFRILRPCSCIGFSYFGYMPAGRCPRRHAGREAAARGGTPPGRPLPAGAPCCPRRFAVTVRRNGTPAGKNGNF